MVSVILSLSQEFLGELSSTTSTRSPTVRFLRGLCHFCRSCIIARYSLTHLFQNRSVMYCTCLHRLRAYKSCLLNKPGGSVGLPLSRSIWLGVRAYKSLRSSLDGVIGRLSIASASHMAVFRVSSSKVCCFSTE